MASVIKQPESEHEWQGYYELRWQVLRAPWQQPRGSEKDELESVAVHRLAIIDNQIVGVGRLHLVDQALAQIRYMAVADSQQNNGIGRLILQSLEQAAREQAIESVQLNARENAFGFYKKFNYRITGPAATLYGAIKHVQMKKNLREFV